MGEDRNLSIDSHQHVHMIPLIFKVLLRVIKDEGLTDATIRIPAEPISPYILTPSLYFKYSLTGCIKQWVLKTLAFINRKEIKKLKIKPAYFVGIMFSGKFNEEKIKKILPRYLKLAKKNNRDIEFGFHPGFVEKKEDLICGSRKSFNKFYFSLWRKTEYNTLLNIKF